MNRLEELKLRIKDMDEGISECKKQLEDMKRQRFYWDLEARMIASGYSKKNIKDIMDTIQ